MVGERRRGDPGAKRRLSDEESRTVIDTAHEAFISMDAGGFITDWNPEAEVTFGWARREAVGQVLADLIIPERYRQQHWEGLQRFIKTGEGPVIGRRIEIDALHSDGFEFPIELTISSHQEGGSPPRFHAFLHDITARRRAAQYVEAQLAVTRILAEAESTEQLVPTLLEELGEQMDWDFGGFWAPDESEERLRCEAAWCRRERPELERFCEHSGAVVFKAGQGLPGRVWESREPTFVTDVRDDPNFPRASSAAEVGLHAGVCFPLLEGGRCLGVVEFLSAAIGQADENLIDAMRSIGTQVGQHMEVLRERHELLERLDAMARTDQLTGLVNRRGWDEGLPKELSRAQRGEQPLCVALLDLDAFKDFNDRHGHLAGDQALAELASRWAPKLRSTDLLARYGGEEFAIALPAVSIEHAMGALERLRALVPEDLTCSGGVAQWDGMESPEELLGRADAALYEAKRAGRDRVVAAR
jgi:diguanylate cyclase (GGDEF)-like protein/PAS domain S-box-containing protein